MNSALLTHLQAHIFTYLFLPFLVMVAMEINAQETVTGTISSQNTGKPLLGATVISLQTNTSVKTDSLGNFSLEIPKGNGSFQISFLGHDSQLHTYSPFNYGPFHILLIENTKLMDEVIINTGYQSIPREQLTGSVDYIGSKLINRSVSSDILSRLENLAPGLLFNRGDISTDAVSRNDPILIRGRSTITGDAHPLIILDDFPYHGDLNNINPNDIESVTILKDAAAASIWGARAGNGVIVMTSKKGIKPTLRINVTSNLAFNEKPSLFNIRQISAADRIEIEKFLFENGRYNSAANPNNAAARYTRIPEVVELIISNPLDLETRLNALAEIDVRNDLEKYFYRTAVTQQYSVNMSERNEKTSYYLSAGFDKSISNLVGQNSHRVSIRSANTFKVSDRIELNAVINIFHVKDEKGNNVGHSVPYGASTAFSPYTRLADNNGNPLPVHLMLRKSFTDTVGEGKFLNWEYRPIDEINSERHLVNRKDYLINIGSTYIITEGMEAQVKYQFQNQIERAEDLFRERSYYARNLINDFTQINPNTGAITYPFPKGAVLRALNTETISHQGRGQLNFNKDLNMNHNVRALAGFEIRKLTTADYRSEKAGYNEELGTFETVIDQVNLYRRNITGSNQRISLTEMSGEWRDNFISYFFNSSYTYNKRYILTASLRKDEANLFGLNANQKGTPFWSIGAAWEASNETFYTSGFLPLLKLRMSYGVNGNISRAATAKTTIALSGGAFTHQLPQASLSTPPNKNLSWESVKQLNLGVDFSTKNNRLTGAFEYYVKKAINLLAQTPIDPTLGASSMFMNTANMKGKGLDMRVQSVNLNSILNWQTSLVYSYATTEVTKYLMPVATTGRSYLPIALANPLVGRPLYSVLALSWQGLDPEYGNPVGMINGEKTMDYNLLYNNTPLNELVFIGTAQPVHFGAIINSFNYKNIDLSFNISFKGGYYFRRSSLSYSNMLNSFTGHSDYQDRWQKPGDESYTIVPSMVYPFNVNRDNFYQFSQTLVERGDHIRFEDVNIGYNILFPQYNNVIESIRVSAFISNLGMLWAANSHNIDPYYNNIPQAKPRYAFGINVVF
jgi:TonB-linked SusC/RagA family outer membrane protein